MTVIELKGRTDHQKGEYYLQLSLAALRELDNLLEDGRLSASEKATYNRAYTAGMERYDEYVPSSPSQNAILIRTPPIRRAKKLRDQLLAQKKSFRKFLLNFFVRQSDAKRFYKISYRNFNSIRVSCIMNILELQLNRKTVNIRRN